MKIKNKLLMRDGHRILLFSFLCLFALSTIEVLYANKQIRSQSDKKVYIVHTDKLSYNAEINKDAQILVGNVQFFHNEVHMYCDSAHFYESSNSFEGFHNVRMLQGDTITLEGDYIYYKGNEQLLEVRRGVVLTHNTTILRTDNLNYDRLYELGYFFEGGTLYDDDNVLTSEWGEYSPVTNEAIFNYNVKLDNPQFTITSDTLHYNTENKMVHIVGPSNVVNGDNHIYSESGWYDTNNEFARLLSRSIITNNGRKIIGDSVVYNSKTSVGEAFVDVIYTDVESKNIITGDYCYYNDSLGYALATERAVVKEFSQTDTLYMHADTLKLFTYNIDTDSIYREVHGYYQVRMYRKDMQAVCDSLLYSSKDSCISLFGDPIIWSEHQQLLGERINIYMNDSTIEWTHVINQALSVEQIDSTHYNQVSSREMKAYFDNGVIKQNNAIGNVTAAYYPIDSDSLMIGMNYTETNELRLFLEEGRMHRIWMPAATGTLYPITGVPKEKRYLPDFAWFDYIRPRDKDDIFEWRGKNKGSELKKVVRGEAPIQNLEKIRQQKRR